MKHVPDNYGPINPKCQGLLHGGDYNPDQWPREIWDEDMRLMKLAHCNAMSVGIFSWVHLEPEEGRFTFDWLDVIMDKLANNGGFAVLATPSGSKPAWMSQKYPEICRISPDGVREPHRGRHNHCLTSPVYREKVQGLNRRLAERYKDHPALLVWHLSNEYNGDCHCDLCYAAFRRWLRSRYECLDALNAAWWSAFWSHDFTDWDQIEPVDSSLHGMMLDWKRFVTDQTIDFCKAEMGPLRELTPDIPITTNFMGTFRGLDYRRFAQGLDVVAWDSYPQYSERPGLQDSAVSVSFTHDMYRAFKDGRPFMLMESTPSVTNWQAVMKLKRPGMHQLEALQAVAHGSDTVQYFQWRAGRGGCEKFHGAVVQHDGTEKPRVFKDVASVGRILETLAPVAGTTVRPQVGIIFDWENAWALEQAAGPRAQGRDYEPTCIRHYKQLWRRGIPADVIGMDNDFTKYKLVIAPMLYMIRPGVAERLEKFVSNGGVLVTTYWSGIADEHDLCFYGGRPGPLRKLLGIWSEELDVLYDDEANAVSCSDPKLGLKGEFETRVFCDLIHTEGAEVLGAYSMDFYAGRPALTRNEFGSGAAYYIAFRGSDEFLSSFYDGLLDDLDLRRLAKGPLPEGVTVQVRGDGVNKFLFVLNFSREKQSVDLGDQGGIELITGVEVNGMVMVEPFGSAVVQCRAE